MSTIESSIEAALLAHAAAMVAFGGPLAGLPVSWPNVAFTKPTGSYLRVSHLPNTSRRMLIGSTGPHQRRGLLQVDAFVAKNVGSATSTEMAGKIAMHFPTGLCLASGGIAVRVTKSPDVAAALADDTHWQVPVTVTYETYA